MARPHGRCASGPTRGATGPVRRAAGLLALTAVAVGAAGCGANTEAYAELQSAMTAHITHVDHRPVASVSCTPHVHDTVRGDTAHLRCVVAFKDGTSYTANAEIENQNSGGRHNMPDLYRWDSPPN
ncbi:hypothetical protein [Streptacidiphilus carbonis]|uniref:hypothetical protein n=1 Tax=Streptacidiphilus carbonis TaxID=105422 RepID=UPI00126A0BDF|nr:hypothetical protein [Streptacidiphilus carbonis]